MKKRKGIVLAILLAFMPGMLLPETSAFAKSAAEELEDMGEQPQWMPEETEEEQPQWMPEETEEEQPQWMPEETEEEQPQLETVEAEIQGAYQFGDTPLSAEGDIAVFSEEMVDEAKEEAAKEHIYQAIKSGCRGVGISDYSISLGRVGFLLSDMFNEHPDLYFIGRKYSYEYIEGEVQYLWFERLDYIHTDLEQFYSETRKALSVVKDGMSDMQKAVALHDYLALNCEYDYKNYLEHKIPPESYTAYGVLVNHIGVCNGYALAYKYLLNEVGINCYMVTSESMNHAWNLVELDGSYYHVDVTWDDPTWDLIGRVRHKYMLKSMLDFVNHHNGWKVTQGSEVIGIPAINPKYDHAFWNNVDSPLVLTGEQWEECYYIGYDSQSRTGKIRKASLSALSFPGKDVADIGRWTVWGGSGGYWQNAYSGLFLYQDRLYYNDISSVYSIEKDGTGKREEFAADTTSGYIYGSALCQGKVRYSLHQTPNITEKETVLTADIAIEEEEMPQIPVREVVLEENELLMAKGETILLQAGLAPVYTTCSDIISWESSDPSVALVENGKITAVSVGNCTVTAKAGGKRAVCGIKVVMEHQAGDIAGGRDGKVIWRIAADGTLFAEGNGELSSVNIGFAAPWNSSYAVNIKVAKMNIWNMADASWLLGYCKNLVDVDFSGSEARLIPGMLGSRFETVRLPANLTQTIVLPEQTGRHWEDENGVCRSEAVKGLPSAMTYRSVEGEGKPATDGDKEQDSSNGGGDKEQTPSNGNGDKEQGSSNGGGEQIPSDGSTASGSSDSEKPASAAKKIPVKSISLKGISKKIAMGKSISLTAKVLPKNADNKTLVWKSSNPKYVSVSQKGKVSVKNNKKAVGKKVRITAVAADGSGKKASYQITVMRDSVKKIKLIASGKKVKAGKTVKIKAKITTTGKKANKELVWSSSNPAYASVSKSGQVKTKKAGKGITSQLPQSPRMEAIKSNPYGYGSNSRNLMFCAGSGRVDKILFCHLS